VDQERLAAYGISAGGYIVPRSATRERRIKACVANSMIFNMYNIFRFSPIPKVRGLVRLLANWRMPFQVRMIELIAWRWGLDGSDFRELVEKNREVLFDPGEITCPTLILIGEGEYQNDEIRRQQQHALQVLPDPRKKIIVGPMNEGAAHHCMGENLGLLSAFVFDWLDEVFGAPG
jgi:alpha-beta hydrolase superfamily lysophospholipase